MLERTACRRLVLLWMLAASVKAVAADRPIVELEIRNHLFHPAEILMPAHTKVKLIVYNRDPTPEEFESYELNREKVIMGGQRAIIFIGPLAPGEYPFFGEFNPNTAQGKIIVK
ncbi:cupredoxin domain-containing protein [Microbulbifer guangxiensis]|uniref:cupredoxin domain-containing protein n=1 Tax=Microbulbifer guangxiensis TaxID=2904249 RepID=UPI002104A0E8|nr:cupredoxin domain-containing protein [Microbulbifer guangxiensis]